MSDFLQHLVTRFTSAEPMSRPRLPSLFEPFVAVHAAPEHASLDSEFAQPHSPEVDLPPRGVDLDSSSRAVDTERLDGETDSRPTRPVPPIVREPIVTEPMVREPIVTEPIVTEPIVREPQSTALPESRDNEPAAVSEARDLSPPAMAGPDKPAAQTISQVREKQIIIAPIEMTQVRQASEMSLAAPRPASEQTPPLPAGRVESATKPQASAETQSPAFSRRQTQVELSPAPRPSNPEFTLTPAAVKPHDTQSPFSATRAFDVPLADHHMAEFAAGPIVAATELNQASLLSPIIQSSALMTPSAEAPRFDHILQETAAAASPPTVNVTIGRVEITATPATSAPRRTRKNSAVMKLESYLRQNAAGGGG